MHFRTTDEIKQEIEEFDREEEERIKKIDSGDGLVRKRSLRRYRPIYDAKPIWDSLANKKPEDKEEIARLLCHEGYLYGGRSKNFNMAVLIRYSMTPKQRSVCYNILLNDWENFNESGHDL